MIETQTMRINRGFSFEREVLKAYGGESHVPFKDGTRGYSKGCSVIDILRETAAGLEAIECKSFTNDFYHRGFDTKYQLKRMLSNIPVGMRCRIVLEDINLTESEKKVISDMYKAIIDPVYHDIPIDFLKRREE